MTARIFSTCRACNQPFTLYRSQVDRGKGRYCSKECYRSDAPSLSDVFWSKVQRSSDDCWTWQGSRSNRGYGKLSYRGRDLRAHRVAWELAHGDIPPRFVVMHTCDNPPCVRLDHLKLGTMRANNQDRDQKGRTISGMATKPWRAAKGDANGTHTHPERVARGEHQGLAKLNTAAIRHIRSIPTDFLNIAALAHQYGVSSTAIRNARLGRTWQHVGDQPPLSS